MTRCSISAHMFRNVDTHVFVACIIHIRHQHVDFSLLEEVKLARLILCHWPSPFARESHLGASRQTIQFLAS